MVGKERTGRCKEKGRFSAAYSKRVAREGESVVQCKMCSARG